MKTLAQRLQHVMESCGWTKADLARAAGVTDAAAIFWLDGRTHSLKGHTAAQLEQKSGFRAAWISSGKGTKLVDPSEQGDMLTPAEVEHIKSLRLLTPEQQAEHMREVASKAKHNQSVIEQHMLRLAGAGTKEPPPRS